MTMMRENITHFLYEKNKMDKQIITNFPIVIVTVFFFQYKRNNTQHNLDTDAGKSADQDSQSWSHAQCNPSEETSEKNTIEINDETAQKKKTEL